MLKKVIIIMLAIIAISSYISNEAYAMDNVRGSGDSFLAAADSTPVIDEGKLGETSKYIYNILFTIAVVLAFAIGMVIGIQFILGSAEEQAKVKETLVPYVIGVFIVFASFTIWKIVVGIGNEVAPTPTQTESQIEQPIVTNRSCPSCGRKLLKDGTCSYCQTLYGP